ncbi:hypothetical protein EW026_g5564 [Hermanssonia centrifuga]|uniref:Multifunctional fusion protein n=1 Tax=Hermanssonia centrifuga TaxID=98765 RepID=A0A4S4KE12_9APHY|nr:hypothetical protein EW026_g5564 [Hermanssonia centrifuga]
MKAAFHILTYEKEAQKKKLGASVFGPNEVYMKLKAYKTRLLSSSLSGKLPKLYFVKLDVQACFDTIEQTKLLQILRTILSEEEYLIQRHGQVGVAANKAKRTYVKMAMPADDHPHFLKMASKLAEALRHTIFVDQVLYPTAERKEILELLEQHITDNIVKIGNDYYRQVVGIPQGSILSTLLCSFFYGDLERTTLKFTEDTSSVLLRLIDDYLLVTTDLAQARKFLNVMNKGHAEYGCFISRDKTLTNFHDETFPWCGYLIDMSDLSVSVDYSRFHSTCRGHISSLSQLSTHTYSLLDLQDSLTVDLGRRPGVTFTQKMLRLAKSRSHIIFTDSRLNSIQTVYKTIYQNFLLTAMKMHYYIRIWKLDLSRSSAFILSTVRQMIRYAYATMRVKALNKISKACGGQCEAQKAPVLWLGTHAFHTVLSRKSHAYCGILKSLEVDMNFSQYRRLKADLPGGKTFDFEELKGKVVLVVNVASKCGFTPQYKGLQAIYDKYKDKDFVILGFPCNQFGGQEPADDTEIASFCELNHGVTFPLMKKSDVNGDHANDVYKYLKEQKSGILGLSRIKWNFEKFLIDKEGQVIQRWASTTSPEAIDKELEKLL